MSKIIREQMQAVEAERALQKSKRKEYSEAAVSIFIALISFSLKKNDFLHSGHNFVLKKMNRLLNIKKNYVNKKNKDVHLIPF